VDHFTSPKTLALLDDRGADLTVRDADGQTPLEIARLNGKSRLVRRARLTKELD
jgi:hypothetical protein